MSHSTRALFVAVLICSACLHAQIAPSPENAPPPPPKVDLQGDISGDVLTPKIIESWNTPALTGSDLQLGAVIPGDVDTIDGVYVHEIARVQWRPADPIDLFIIKPVGVKNPPVILYLYSYPYETDRFLNHDTCKFLVSKGYAAIGFATALTGQRYHDRPMKQWFVSEMSEALADSAHDVQMILNYIDSRHEVDMSRVGIWGDGSGATIAILAAAADKRIKTLDLLDPWGDWPEWAATSSRIPEKERPTFVAKEWQDKAAPLDPLLWLPKLKTQKIRVQFIQDVKVTPLAAQKKIEAALPPNAKVVHYDDSAAFRAAIAGGTGFDWIKDEMKTGKGQIYSAGAQPKEHSSRPQDSQQ